MSTRRDFLAFTAGAVATKTVLPLAAGAEPVQHPDADLLAAAERFIEHERAIRAMPCDASTEAEEEAQEADQRHMFSIQRALTLELETMRATTADGIAARARCLAVHNADGAFSMEDPNTTTGRLLRYLRRDAGAPGAVAEPVVQPDAELLAACAEFDALERAYLATFTGFKAGSPEEDAAEAEQERLHADQEPLVDRICDLRAVTREG